ncbi:MAG: protein kinase [Myxococcota bacterium]
MSDLQPGTLIDNRYLVEAEIGRGGMAAVYRVRHAQLGTLAALKVLTLPAASIQQRLMHEGRVQAALQHPNIVSVSDVVVHNGAPGLVMEYVRGPSLDDFLLRRKLTIEQADEIAQGVLRGVGAAHAHGLIHRDLKPANIMLAITAQGLVPKVTDFGLVKMIMGEEDGMSKTRSGVAMGTPSYMAPEQISDAKKVDKRADIFSLGAILYEIVSSERTFDGNDMFKIFSAIVGGQYTPIREHCPDLPERMVRAIEGALTPDREERIDSVETLLAIWQGHSDAAGAAASSRGPWDADLLREASTMGAGGESTADALKRSFKGNTPPPTGEQPAFDPQRTGQTFTPHDNDQETIYEDELAEEAGAALARTQSTMAPMPGMFDDPMPASVQRPPSAGVPRPAPPETDDSETVLPEERAVVPASPSTESVPAGPRDSRTVDRESDGRSPLPLLAIGGVVVFLAGIVLVGGGAWATGMFTPAVPPEPHPVEVLPTPDPVEPVVPELPGPEPVASPTPTPTPVAPSPTPVPTPTPTVPTPTPTAPAPTPDPVPDPEPAPVPIEPVPVAEPAPAPVPEPTPEPAAAPPQVWIDSGGITVALRKQNGLPADLEALTPGTYQVVAFFTTPSEPFDQGEITIAPGEIWQVRCVPNLRRCTIKKK